MTEPIKSLCPSCNKVTDMTYPARSRRGDYNVCSPCGQIEALADNVRRANPTASEAFVAASAVSLHESCRAAIEAARPQLEKQFRRMLTDQEARKLGLPSTPGSDEPS